ncbi:DUF4942 domain-containing protein [Tritonibacter mobilis]|uniref:DUF4942 domain-containing protein n=1 Tax=Tritonibacter mobilis TaxID=379347 RepID=UPI000806A5F4|nr:DUF4942 domain-containing protein [Tritonibacter mobilis]
MQTAIAPRATITQLVGIRDRALKRYAALLKEGEDINEMIAPLNEQSHRLPTITTTTNRSGYSTNTSVESYRKQLDAGAWDHLMDKTELRDLMSANQKSELRSQLQENPPEFTLEAAVATFEDMRNRAGDIFRQGLVDVFEALPRDFRSHDGFKIGGRCVMTYAVSWWSGRASWQHSTFNDRRSQLADLDRTFHSLTGKNWTLNASDVASRAMQEGETEVETEFFRIRWFRNGNIHVWFTDKEATRDANKLLAKHYGAKLGQMHLHPDQRAA